MKRNLLVTTAAAALLLGTVFAVAQGVQQRPGGGAEPGMQGGAQGGAQTAPSEGKGKAQSKEPRTQGQGQREQGQRKGQQQQPKMKGKEQAQPKEPGTRGQGQREQGQREGQTQQQPKQQPQQGQQTPRGDTQKTQKGAEGKAGVGQSGDVKLTTEQRTKIRTTVLQGGNAPRVTNVDFSVTVGTVVPRERVKLVAVPPTLVEIHPAWRGYMYFITGERIIIVEPSSYKIVAVLVV